MSGMQSKAARLQKEHKEKPLADTEREMAASEDFKYNDVSSVMMKKFNALMEMQDMMFVEMRESLKNDLKEMLVKRAPPELKSSEHRRAQQEGKESAAERPKQGEKVEEESSGTDDTENLTVKSEEKSKLSRKQDKKQHKSQRGGVKPSLERAGEALHRLDDRCRDGSGQVDVLGEDPKTGEDKPAKETRHQNKENPINASGEDSVPQEGAILRLAADFSSASLDINKRWGSIFRLLKEKELEPELQCSVRLAFKCDGESKTFSDLYSLRQFTSTNPFLRELLKDVLPQNEARHGGRNGLQERLGLTVVQEHGVEKITRSSEEIGLISLIVDSESEEGNLKNSQTKKKETFYGLRELSFSYLVWDSEEKKLVKCQEGGAAAMTSQGTGTPCLTLYLASPSESLQAGSDGPKSHSHSKLSVPSQVTPLLVNMEKGRYKALQAEELMAKEADLIHETEENFRRSVISTIRQMQKEVEDIKKLYFFDVLNMKSSMDDLNSLACMIEARVNEQEDAVEGLTKETMQLAKEIVDKERLREREDRLRSSNIRVIGIPEKENRENGAEDIIKEIIEENFAELEDPSLEIVSAHRIPNAVDEHRLTPRHILVKFWSAGDKQKILKASRAKKEITYRGSKIRLTADLSPGTIDARSQWSGIIKILQEEGFQPRILYPAKLAFDFKGKTKVFFDIEEFKKFVSEIPFLKELLSNLL
ncbi:LINE-1 type transposase domain-containing protein 1 [Phodopus roborovskii]|uniref:LINE-1 type transposase domain-containing protein 1 n=1 Tax=Phodopus roborovskii TaxID=109678 RepID=UPI0021E472E9|nr:LINE-1 type transposase domain-containing protein 1 [Phodopus roborovskii]